MEDRAWYTGYNGVRNIPFTWKCFSQFQEIKDSDNLPTFVEETHVHVELATSLIYPSPLLALETASPQGKKTGWINYSWVNIPMPLMIMAYN